MKYFSQICFLGINMGDRLEARISAIENIQEEFGHGIREVKEHLARLTSLFKDYIKTQTVLPRGLSPVPTQYASRPSPRPFIPTTNHLPHGIGRPNLRQSMTTTPSAFMEHLDLPINRAAQEANLVDKRLARTSPAGTPSPLLTPSCSQSW